MLNKQEKIVKEQGREREKVSQMPLSHLDLQPDLGPYQ